MNRRPPQPLDAEERALAAMLPRPHGRSEPDAELDARILAAAGAATRPQPAARRKRRSWIGPTSLAASLVLAMGLAWQLRPPPAPVAHEQAAASAAPESDATAVLAIEAPPREVPEQPKPALPAPRVQAPPMSAIPATPRPSEKRVAAPVEPAGIARTEAAPAAAAAPPPPPPAPAPPPTGMVGESVSVPQASQPARAPAMAKSRESEAARQRATTAGNAAAQAEDAAGRAAADAATLDAISVDDPGEDVPPATADSPQVRDAWLRRIGELLEQGRADEAKASLAEFKRRYPDAALPPELRELEP